MWSKLFCFCFFGAVLKFSLGFGCYCEAVARGGLVDYGSGIINGEESSSFALELDSVGYI